MAKGTRRHNIDVGDGSVALGQHQPRGLQTHVDQSMSSTPAPSKRAGGGGSKRDKTLRVSSARGPAEFGGWLMEVTLRYVVRIGSSQSLRCAAKSSARSGEPREAR